MPSDLLQPQLFLDLQPALQLLDLQANQFLKRKHSLSHLSLLISGSITPTPFPPPTPHAICSVSLENPDCFTGPLSDREKEGVKCESRGKRV